MLKSNNIKIFTISLLMVGSLTACGSQTNSSQVESIKNNTAQMEDSEAAENIETENGDNVSETEASENFENPEPIQYDGIDLNSPLPTYEWVASSFPGVMDPYKFVVYNDDTHYRVIVENGDHIKFHRDDKVLLFEVNTAHIWDNLEDDVNSDDYTQTYTVGGYDGLLSDFWNNDVTVYSDNYEELLNRLVTFSLTEEDYKEPFYSIDNFYYLDDDTWSEGEGEIIATIMENGEKSEFHATLVFVD